MLSVAVEDVAPDGTVNRLTGGWQVISHRALDTTRSRYLDGKLIQPFHPFTRAAEKPLARGAVAPVDVEVFPTGASIEPGHRLADRGAGLRRAAPDADPAAAAGHADVDHDPQLGGRTRSVLSAAGAALSVAGRSGPSSRRPRASSP